MNYNQILTHKQFIIDCRDAGILEKNIAEKKLQYLSIVEENLIKQLNQIEKNKTTDLKNAGIETPNETETDDLVSNVLN